MWVSKEIVSGGNEKGNMFFGKVTDADSTNLNVQTDIENRNPMNVRKSPEFSRYFDILWKELDVDAKEK